MSEASICVFKAVGNVSVFEAVTSVVAVQAVNMLSRDASERLVLYLKSTLWFILPVRIMFSRFVHRRKAFDKFVAELKSSPVIVCSELQFEKA